MNKDQNSAQYLVARFLASNNYNETLEAFLTEANLPPDAARTDGDTLTIETVLHEKAIYDISQTFEKTALNDQRSREWQQPAPQLPSPVIALTKTPSNLLHVNQLKVQGDADGKIIATTADRRIYFLEPQHGFNCDEQRPQMTVEAPVLASAMVGTHFMLMTSMSGSIALFDLSTGRTIAERRDHQKYVVKAAVCRSGTGTMLATAAWDAKVLIYDLGQSSDAPTLSQPIGRVSLASNPECIEFIQHPDSSEQVLVLSRRDSTFLYYYRLPKSGKEKLTDEPEELVLIGKQNLAPHSNAWIAFTPSAFATSPIDPSVIAVATSHQPHMKVIIAQLLVPPLNAVVTTKDASASLDVSRSSTAGDGFGASQAQVAEARAALALQDREAAAIQVQISTLAPQTAYSTPALAWRPDGSGVWTNGDDGVVRGVEVSTGKIMATLRGGHEPGSKIRCLWAGSISGKEVLLSGGFDRRLILWNTA